MKKYGKKYLEEGALMDNNEVDKKDSKLVKKKWIIWTVLIVFLTNIATFYFTGSITIFKHDGKVEISKSDYNNYTQFKKMYDIKDTLYKLYDGKITDSDLVQGAIKGMTASLNDPYTVFMDKKEYSDFSSQTQGNYSGLGIQVKVKGNDIVVVTTFDGSPAKKAGILPDDVITKVNGKAVTGKELDNAVTMMKGADGTEVTLTMYRQSKGSFDLKMKRAKISTVTVTGEMLTNKIGYIQMTMFDENTSKNFNKELATLQGKGMKSLILDLRGNPGGVLDECVNITSNFITKGKTIVYTIDKYNQKTEYKSKGGSAIGMPLVVLVDEGSASASEIFSGAIRDYKAGTLVGTKTFGKGVVQTILETGEGTALKVTISKYYTPSGENIQGKGINPDVSVEIPKDTLTQEYDRSKDPQFQKALEIITSKTK